MVPFCDELSPVFEVDDVSGETRGGGEEKKERSDGGQEWFHGVVLR
jgi:hypothetical protein